MVPGEPHHVVQRGNDRKAVFFSDDDRAFYLNLLRKQSWKFKMTILAYCLMPNHVHLIVIPRNQDSLAKGIGRTHFYYTSFVNKKYGKCGHLWQNRFYSCLLDGPHLYHASKYVERNPVRAGLIRNAWEFPWSSAEAHVKNRDERDLLDLRKWPDWGKGKPWKKELRIRVAEDVKQTVRKSTMSGRPLGSSKYLDRIERRIGRRVRAAKVGRPRKRAVDEEEK